MKANAVLLTAGCGCFWAIIDDEDSENGTIINRTFYSVQTGQDLDVIGEIEKDWGVNYVGSWDEYHLFELFFTYFIFLSEVVLYQQDHGPKQTWIEDNTIHIWVILFSTELDF